MKIIGGGMIARSFQPYIDDPQLRDVVIFASGVSDSATTAPEAYIREQTLLFDTLRACEDSGQRLVYFSSGGAIYGPRNATRTETSPTYPTTDYGRQQLLCEGAIINSGAPYLIIRLPNLVGPNQRGGQLIPTLVHQAMNGHARLFTRATRDLLDVDDSARLVVGLLHNHVAGEIVTVASGRSLPIDQIFTEICAILSITPETERIDKGDTQQFDISKLRYLLGDTLDVDALIGEDYLKRILLNYVPSLVK